MGRRAIVLLVALVLAGLAAWAVWNYLQGVEADIKADQALTSVFRAGAAGIDEGSDGSTLLSNVGTDKDVFSIVEGTQDQIEDIPEDAITDSNELTAVLTGKVAAGPISPNSILAESQWTQVTIDVTPLAEEIPDGKQAMTISVDNVRGINGFVEPGDRINMIITLDISADLLPEEFSGITVVDPDAPPPDPTADPNDVPIVETVSYTRYVLQGLPVMATGRDIRPDEDAPVTVDVAGDTTAEGADATVPEEDTGNATIFTLEVTHEQAERIAYAFESGSIWLTLSPVEHVDVETQGVTIDNLFGEGLLDDIFGTSG